MRVMIVTSILNDKEEPNVLIAHINLYTVHLCVISPRQYWDQKKGGVGGGSLVNYPERSKATMSFETTLGGPSDVKLTCISSCEHFISAQDTRKKKTCFCIEPF